MQVQPQPPFAGANPIELLANEIYLDCLVRDGNGGTTLNLFFSDEGEFCGALGAKCFSVNPMDKMTAITRNYAPIHIRNSCDASANAVFAIRIDLSEKKIMRLTDKAWSDVVELKASTFKDYLFKPRFVTDKQFCPVTEIVEPCKSIETLIDIVQKLNKLFQEHVNSLQGDDELIGTEMMISKMFQNLLGE